MSTFFRNVTLVFAAGCAGGLINSLAVWIFGETGITSTFGVKIAPAFTPHWLYPRIVWGGIWGFLFLLPLMRNRILSRGLLLSLGPTFVQLFVVFPLKAHKGYMGVDHGTLTFLFVFIYNALWGIATAVWLRWAGKTR